MGRPRVLLFPVLPSPRATCGGLNEARRNGRFQRRPCNMATKTSQCREPTLIFPCNFMIQGCQVFCRGPVRCYVLCLTCDSRSANTLLSHYMQASENFRQVMLQLTGSTVGQHSLANFCCSNDSLEVQQRPGNFHWCWKLLASEPRSEAWHPVVSFHDSAVELIANARFSFTR